MDIETKRVEVRLSDRVKLLLHCRLQAKAGVEEMDDEDDGVELVEPGEDDVVLAPPLFPPAVMQPPAALVQDEAPVPPPAAVPSVQCSFAGADPSPQKSEGSGKVLTRKQKSKARSKRRQVAKREATRLQSSLSAPCPPLDPIQRARLAKKHTKTAVVLPHPTELSTGAIEKTKTGHEGRRFEKEDVRTVEELQELGYTELEWDGG